MRNNNVGKVALLFNNLPLYVNEIIWRCRLVGCVPTLPEVFLSFSVMPMCITRTKFICLISRDIINIIPARLDQKVKLILCVTGPPLLDIFWQTDGRSGYVGWHWIWKAVYSEWKTQLLMNLRACYCCCYQPTDDPNIKIATWSHVTRYCPTVCFWRHFSAVIWHVKMLGFLWGSDMQPTSGSPRTVDCFFHTFKGARHWGRSPTAATWQNVWWHLLQKNPYWTSVIVTRRCHLPVLPM